MERNKVYYGDCTEMLNRMEPGSVDLVFDDPPFNLGKTYGDNDDSKKPVTYKNWCRAWIKASHRVLKSTGAIWIAINDENAAHMYISLEEAGFVFRNWNIWFYTFGQNQRKKFSRCHTHLLYFTMHAKNFTFNADAIKVPSARQLIYKDKRAKHGGKVPDDVWEYPDDELWNYSRVCGSYKVRNTVDHQCQMAEGPLNRIILSTSNPGDLVVDPFSGTGTTAAVAKKNGRDFIAIDNCQEYVDGACERLLSPEVHV